MFRCLVIGCLVLCASNFSLVSLAQDTDTPADSAPGIKSDTASSLKFRSIGPALMSGRILDIAVDPTRRSTWYIATVGGVWKTSNAGVTWQSIFDKQGSYSIGCVTIDPTDRFTIWVGTGENNSQRSVGYGDGVYKSTDGGASFTKVGLPESEHIGKIIVHPEDGNTVFVAAQGPLWRSGGERGLYKTTDGGKTWSRVLHISDDTGVNEVLLDPTNPNIMYASAYQRRRHTWTLINGGPESGLYKSTDGGDSWEKINSGLPAGDKGRIGLAISPHNSEIVYAIVEAVGKAGGFYRSANRGESWQRMSDYVSGSPQYYQELVACPHKMDRVYAMDTYMMVSEDGGKTFNRLGEADKHVDNHALIIDPIDADHLLVGCDGGVYESWDRGKTYDFKANLPITQFYKVALSNEKPFYYVYGGTQDNATQGGPSQTPNVHGIRNSDWFITVFGDGFDPAVDPEDPDTIYSQWQYGGLVRYDRKTGVRVEIKPQPAEGGPVLRWNWDSALMISPHNHQRVYYGSQILFRSDDRGDSWNAVSEDLSRNLDRNKLKVMGRVWGVDVVAKNESTSLYGTIVSVSESPQVEGLLYVGTDDGMVQVSEDGGKNWRGVSKFGTLKIPEFGYINDIEADLYDADTVYVAINNHKRGDFKPYIVKSSDRGRTWTEMTGDLPERGSVYTLKQDHVNPNLLFCGTEFGCFYTINGGEKWVKLATGLPTVCVRDLEIQRDENDLVLATFGRGFYILDNYSLLRDLPADGLKDNQIFPIRQGKMFAQSAPLAVGRRAFQGASFYSGDNPEYGVRIDYYLNASLKTKKSLRQQQDRSAAEKGADSPYPSWDELKAEDREASPRVWLTLRDAQGHVVRSLKASTSKGLHRTFWNYTHAGFDRGAPVAVPGKYTVDLMQMVDGEVTQLVEPVAFEIQPISFQQMSAAERKTAIEFSRKVLKLSNTLNATTQVLAETQNNIDKIKSGLKRDPKLDPTLENDVRAIELKLLDINEAFRGDPTKSRRNENAYPGFLSRLGRMASGAIAGPTGTHRAQFEIIVNEYKRASKQINEVLKKDLPALNKKLDNAKAPWTPGRAIPKLN
ncbi:MAG: glycosyl hydrolase [Rhodopirellula sp. TMED11]|nr:MAG: glycosyl hydrolase [Rhodopirellula sp. TMED11]